MFTWHVILFLVTFGLFLLPLVPAFLELMWPTDAQPLKVVQAYDNNPMHFADGFDTYIGGHFNQMDNEVNRDGQLPDGTQYQMVGPKGEPRMDGKTNQSNRLLVSRHSMNLADSGEYGYEVYSGLNIITGLASRFRALLARDTLTIKDRCRVLRWAHSDGDMIVGRDCTLHGRVTSRKKITLGVTTRFERLHAPKIVCGTELTEPALTPIVERVILEKLTDQVKLKRDRRHLLENDLNFPANSTFDGDIIAGSTAIVGDHAHIKGSLKSNAMNDLSHYLHSTGVIAHEKEEAARCKLGNHVHIDGSVISTHDLYIGRECRLLGPVIAENILVIRSGTVIGTPQHPTTVTAREIIIESGCVVFGTLWATQQGIVQVPLQQDGEVKA